MRARRIVWVLALVLGLSAVGWIGFNYLIELQPAARGRDPILPLVFSLVLIFVAVRGLVGDRRQERER